MMQCRPEPNCIWTLAERVTTVTLAPMPFRRLYANESIRNLMTTLPLDTKHPTDGTLREASAMRKLRRIGSPVLWISSTIMFGFLLVISVAIIWDLPLVALLALPGLALVGIIAAFLIGPHALLAVIPLYLFRNPVMLLAIGQDSMSEGTTGLLRGSLAIPDLLMLVMLVALLVRRPTRRSYLHLLGAVILLGAVSTFLFAHFVASDAPVSTRLAYLRSFLLPVAIFIAGRSAIGTKLKPAFRFIFVQVAAAAILGVIAYVLNTSESWVELGGHYFHFKHGGADNMLPGIWSTTFFGMRFLRFGGTLLDPIAFGYWSLGAVVAAFTLRRWLLGAFFCICIFLSLSKGALLGLVIILLFGFWHLWRRNAPLRLLVLFGALVVAALLPVLSSEGKGSFWVHLEGAQYGLRSAVSSPLGKGLGMGGNWTGIMTGTADLQTGAESGFGVIGYQLGIVGLLVAASFFLWQIWVRGASRGISATTASFSFGLVLALTVLLLLQENALSASAAFPLWWLIGRTTPEHREA